MKSLMKKYYEMDDEVRDDLELLYIYQCLISILNEYENVKFNKIVDLEKVMQIIQKCMITTDFSIDFIITNILEILSSQDITIKDLYNLELDEMLEILFTDDESEDSENNKQEILSEFTYGDYYCIFCQNRNKYLFIINKGEDSNVIVINSINEILDGTFAKKLLELQSHE